MPKYIDPKEFAEAGYLLEINRQFLHPLGMAIGIVIEEDGSARIEGVRDFRDDPEGCIFAEIDEADRWKAARVQQEWESKAQVRRERFGWVVQPVGSKP